MLDALIAERPQPMAELANLEGLARLAGLQIDTSAQRAFLSSSPA